MKKYIIFLTFFVLTNIVYSQSTGWIAPGTVTTNGDVSFVNPNNSKVCNDVYAVATFTSGGQQSSLVCTNFGFTIPAGAVIDSVGTRVRGTSLDENLSRVLTITYTDASTTSPDQTLNTDNNYYDFTFPDGDIGFVATVSQINNSSFGVTVLFTGTDPCVLSIDCIGINIAYHLGRNKRILE